METHSYAVAGLESYSLESLTPTSSPPPLFLFFFLCSAVAEVLPRGGKGRMVCLHQRRSRDGIMLLFDAESVTARSFNCTSVVPVVRLWLCRTTAWGKYPLLRGALLLLLLSLLLFLLFAVKDCRWYLVCALHRYLLMQTSALLVNWQLPPRLLLQSVKGSHRAVWRQWPC